MDLDLVIVTWGARQSFALLVAIGSVLQGISLIKLKPNAPDMNKAARLPPWRKAIIFFPSALYLALSTASQSPIGDTDNLLADIYGNFKFYDPLLYIAIVTISIVINTNLSGDRALRLALSSLGSVLLMFFAMIPVVLGLHAIHGILGGRDTGEFADSISF